MKPSRRQLSRKEKASSDFVYLVVLILFGALLRLDLLIANNFVIDSDEAIVGLMGKHIVEGSKVPTFYYGQHYMGSLEAVVASVYFRFFGISNQILKLVPLTFSLLLIPVIYFLTREITGKFGARVAALWMALPSSALVVWSSMARGGFIELVLIGSIALFFTCRWLKAERKNPFLALLIGLFLGFGWWVNNQILYFMAAIGISMLLGTIEEILEKRGRLRVALINFLMVVFGFVLGGYPFWSYNIKDNFPSFGIFRLASGTDLIDHLKGFFETAFPILFGAKPFWETKDLYPYATGVIWGIYGLLFLVLLILRGREIFQLILGRIDSSKPVELFLLFVGFSILIFAASSFGYLVKAPRYLLPLYVGVYVLAAYVLDTMYNPSPVVARSLAIIVVGINLFSYYPGHRMIPGEPFVFEGERVSKDHTKLLQWLKDHQVQKVHTNYWIGYRLAFETLETVTFSMFQEPRQVRIPWYEKEQDPILYFSYPFILVPSQAKLVKEGLDVLGYDYNEENISGYVIYYGVRPRNRISPELLHAIPREILEVSATQKQEDAIRAIDGEVQTRWGTGEPQKAGMEFSVTFNPPQPLNYISYKLGGWKHDYPREFSLVLETGTGEKQIALSPSQTHAIQYLLDKSNDLSLYVDSPSTKKVILKQEGHDPVFDWSIAELEFRQKG